MTKRFCKRPWGFWLVLLNREHFKVKLLRFKRGGRLSNQYHEHRSELWLFVKGHGDFECVGWDNNTGSGMFRLATVKQLHRFTARSTTWVLEIQYGEKCDEGDITRV